jgi:hypothetical protein
MVAGMGRHTREEIIKIVHDDLQALSSQLGKRPYLMGDKPTKVEIKRITVFNTSIFIVRRFCLCCISSYFGSAF